MKPPPDSGAPDFTKAEASPGQSDEPSGDPTTSATSEFLPRDLDSGDVVLFNRRCSSMRLLGAVLCVVAKFAANTFWDHVGIVVRDPNTNELLFLEADFGGVKLRPLAERIQRSRSKEIAVRKLSLVRTEEAREMLYEFAQEMLDKRYEISSSSVLSRVSHQALKQAIQKALAEKKDYESRLEEINREMKGFTTKAQLKVVIDEKSRVQQTLEIAENRYRKLLEEYNSLVEVKQTSEEDRLSMTQETAVQLSDEQITGVAMPAPALREELASVFCSQLVAAAYQRMGILDRYPPAFDYNPKDFSSEETNIPKLVFNRKASLGPEIYFRISRERVRAEEAKRQRGGNGSGLSVFPSKGKPQFRGITEGDSPSRDSRRVIRDALKRSPVGNTIPDQYKLAGFVRSFTAHILEPGDTLFTQGDCGTDFYVVQSGSVDRFVGKGNESPVLTNTLGSRSSFGATGFLFTTLRNSTIRARQRTLLWKVDRASYDAFKGNSVNPAESLSIYDQRVLRSILTNHFLFSRLDRVGSKEVNAFFPVKFRAGEDIFKQGDTGDNFYIIKSGEVERYIRRPLGGNEDGQKDEENALAKTLRSGQSFGELSLMYNAPRASTVRARTDVELFAISNERFHRLNLGGGTKFLRARFDKYASLTRDGNKYMTPDDFLNKVVNVKDFEDNDRARLSSLLVALVSNNRERDPVAAARKRSQFAQWNTTEESQSKDSDSGKNEIDHERGILMDFWDFVRFDIVLNQPSPEMNFAFRLADQDNTGFISFDEIQHILQMYSDMDDTAMKMLNGEIPTLMEAFGKDGSKLLSAEEFHEKSSDIIPPTFRKDVQIIAEHMRNVEIRPVDDQILRFNEDETPSIIGSLFVSKSASSKSLGNGEQLKNANVSNQQTPNIPYLFCVGVAGAISRTIVAPLERMKIMMQADTKGKYRGLFGGLQKMVREDTSFTRAMFRGNGVNLMRIVPNAFIQLAVVKSMHDMYSRDKSGRLDSRSTSALETVAIGGISGCISTIVLYPLEFARGRISVQNAAFSPYSGAWDALRQAAAKDGIRSIYRGLTPSLLGIFPYVGISFSVFEALHPVLPKRNDGSSMPSAASAIISGAGVMMLAQTVTYPLDLCRRRMQTAGFSNNEPLHSFSGNLTTIYRKAGVTGFFRGITPNLLKVIPTTAVSFFAIEAAQGFVAKSTLLLSAASGPSKTKQTYG